MWQKSSKILNTYHCCCQWAKGSITATNTPQHVFIAPLHFPHLDWLLDSSHSSSSTVWQKKHQWSIWWPIKNPNFKWMIEVIKQYTTPSQLMRLVLSTEDTNIFKKKVGYKICCWQIRFKTRYKCLEVWWKFDGHYIFIFPTCISQQLVDWRNGKCVQKVILLI